MIKNSGHGVVFSIPDSEELRDSLLSESMKKGAVNCYNESYFDGGFILARNGILCRAYEGVFALDAITCKESLYSRPDFSKEGIDTQVIEERIAKERRSYETASAPAYQLLCKLHVRSTVFPSECGNFRFTHEVATYDKGVDLPPYEHVIIECPFDAKVSALFEVVSEYGEGIGLTPAPFHQRAFRYFERFHREEFASLRQHCVAFIEEEGLRRTNYQGKRKDVLALKERS